VSGLGASSEHPDKENPPSVNIDVSVLFYLYTDEEWPPYPAEPVRARLLDSLTAIVADVPWFAYGIARGDHVVLTHDGHGFIARHVRRTGGHSTLRVMATTYAELEPITAQLTVLGADVVVSDSECLLAVDIPPSVDFAEVRRVLSAAESMTCNYEIAANRHEAASGVE
jgi:hypothetical protein